MKFEITLFLSIISTPFVLTACEHDCACVPQGTFAGKTTTATTGYSSITAWCSGDSNVTDHSQRASDCFAVCTQRLADQGVLEGYDQTMGPDAVSCKKDCIANAKLSVTCVQGARAGTLLGFQ